MSKHPLESLSEHFLSEQDLSINTIKSYRFCYKYYVAYLKEHDILHAKTSDVIKYREYRRSLGYSTYDIHIHMSALRSLYRYLRINQVRFQLPDTYQYNIMNPIKSEKIKRQVKKPILTLEQTRHLLHHTKMNRKIIYHYRDYAIISLMVTCGLSPYDIIHLKKEDYQMVDGRHVLLIKKRKRDQTDMILLSKGVIEALDDYLKKRKKNNPYLFISQNQTTPEGHLSRTFFYQRFPDILRRCGLEDTKITPHALRHTAAHLNLLRGASIESTQKLLRHANIHSTLVYKEYIDKMNDHTEEAIESYILKEDSATDDFLFDFLSLES